MVLMPSPQTLSIPLNPLKEDILLYTGCFANHEPQIRCPHCSSNAVIRNGAYFRYALGSTSLIRVQRYLCKSPLCPWRTFSVLPHLVLPVIRHSLSILFDCCQKCVIEQISQAAAARVMQMGRGVVRRLIDFSKQVLSWLNRECTIADWGQELKRFWPAFTRDFSQTFFPGRWAKPPSTQLEPLN